jgi:hypothetical protein
VWKNRRLRVENPSHEVYKVLQDAGMENLLVAAKETALPGHW